MSLDLPKATFAEISSGLTLIALRERMSIEALKVVIAQNPDVPFFASLEKSEVVIKIAEELARMFRQLIPVEDDARSVLTAVSQARIDAVVASAIPELRKRGSSA